MNIIYPFELIAAWGQRFIAVHVTCKRVHVYWCVVILYNLCAYVGIDKAQVLSGQG
jgi:hypothetical protein